MVGCINNKLECKADLVKRLNRLGRKSTKQIISYLYPLDRGREVYGRSLGTKAHRRLRMGRGSQFVAEDDKAG